MSQLPHSIELHDSMLRAARQEGGRLILELRPAYVHREGKGWVQDADIEIGEATSLTRLPSLPKRIEDGELETCEGPYHNLLLLPLSTASAVKFKIEFEGGGLAQLTGSSLTIRLLGEPVFVEAYD